MYKKGGRKPPIYYIQKYNTGVNKISSLGNWMIRELISFLDLEDFSQFVMTSTKFAKFAFDPYVSFSMKPDTLGLVPTARTFKDFQEHDLFLKLSSKKYILVAIELTEPALKNMFYFNPRRQLLYSYIRETLKISSIRSWSDEPVYEKTVAAIPEIVAAEGYGKQFYFVSQAQLLSLHEGRLEGLRYNEGEGWSSLIIPFREVKKSTVQIKILESGKNVVIGLKQAVFLFNYLLESISSYSVSSNYVLYVPNQMSRAYIIGSDTGEIKIFHTYPSTPQKITDKHSYEPIIKFEACKFNSSQCLVYQRGRTLYVNKRELGYTAKWCVYDRYLFNILHFNHFEVYNLDNFEKSERHYSGVKITGIEWMHIDNLKLVCLWLDDCVYKLGLFSHSSKSCIHTLWLQLDSLDKVYIRENILILHGSFMEQPNKVLIVNLSKPVLQ